MEILYLLVPISVLLVFVIAAVFWWSLRHGQFEDLEGPAYRMLMDDDRPDMSKDGAAKAGDVGAADGRK
jgi:cbb3-type cytochrome oxidase maturation protein